MPDPVLEELQACVKELEKRRAQIKQLRDALRGMVEEFERQTKYGSPMAVNANTRYRAALEALSATE